MTLLTDFRFALRSLARVKGLAITVIITLALGIGANAAIFSVVRGVLLRPLVNRDEDRLIYIRQTAKGVGVENAAFSVPEIQDLRGRIKTLSAFGDFSTIDFTMVGLGEPRVVRAGVVGGSYFDVMGLHPVRRPPARPCATTGRRRAGVAVLTYRFWTTSLKSDPSVIGKTVRLGTRTATIVGVLEPSVPYPSETEIIANVVTSPHHLSATMVTGTRAPDDRTVRPAGARIAIWKRLEPSCARCTPRLSSSIPRRIRRRRTSASKRCGCATRSRRGPERSCWCCSRPRRWSSSSPARTSPT